MLFGNLPQNLQFIDLRRNKILDVVDEEGEAVPQRTSAEGARGGGRGDGALGAAPDPVRGAP